MRSSAAAIIVIGAGRCSAGGSSPPLRDECDRFSGSLPTSLDPSQPLYGPGKSPIVAWSNSLGCCAKNGAAEIKAIEPIRVVFFIFSPAISIGLTHRGDVFDASAPVLFASAVSTLTRALRAKSF
jgi:hypothetical protein